MRLTLIIVGAIIGLTIGSIKQRKRLAGKSIGFVYSVLIFIYTVIGGIIGSIAYLILNS